MTKVVDGRNLIEFCFLHKSNSKLKNMIAFGVVLLLIDIYRLKHFLFRLRAYVFLMLFEKKAKWCSVQQA
jgi:hypothetical protein